MDHIKLLQSYEDEMIEMLKELLSIPSVKGDPAEGAPFGKDVEAAFRYMLKKGEMEGFDCVNVDHYGGHIEFSAYEYDEAGEITGKSDEVMGILVHLDVVPEGSGWSFPPYEGKIDGGKIYGRGAIDDKGPAVAAFYAMKALKNAGFKPRKNIRLILGLDEETDWEGMKYYLNKVKAPDIGFSPDAEFPVIHGEMGILVFELAKKFGKSSGDKGLVLRKVEGGNAPNMVPDFARALLSGNSYEVIKEKLGVYKERTGRKLSAKGRGKSLEITAEGVSAHGSTPEKGVNAISVLMDFLGELNFANEDGAEFIQFYNEKIRFDLNGENIGCEFSDDISGKLVFNVGMIQMDEEAGRVTVNVRYPISVTEEQVYDAMAPVVAPFNIGIVKTENKAPIFVPSDNPLVETLMEVYREHTGDLDSKPIVIGGGTYARAAENIVAFGMRFPGEPEVQHQKDEYISQDSIMKGAAIYAEAIYRLTR